MTMADARVDMMGHAKTVKVTKDSSLIVDGAGDKKAIEDRINMIKAELERTDSDFDREKLQERLAKLSGGVAVLKVGAATESELKEKKSRIEDALQATRAASWSVPTPTSTARSCRSAWRSFPAAWPC